MDLDNIMLSEVSQTNNTWYHLYVESKKQYKWIYIQNRNRNTDIENKLIVSQGESEGEREKLRAWDEQIWTTIHKIDKQQGFAV